MNFTSLGAIRVTDRGPPFVDRALHNFFYVDHWPSHTFMDCEVRPFYVLENRKIVSGDLNLRAPGRISVKTNLCCTK